MVFQVLALISVFFISLGLSSTTEELIFVSVIFRHGNRAPLVHYKNDPHKHSFPDGPGQLTKRGKINMFQKGKVLRKLYGGFISVNYRENEVYCTSTNMDRTLMTAQLVLAGMYPPSDAYHHFESHLPWQPIPVHENSPDKSFIFGHGYLCPRYSEVFYEQINSTTQTINKELLAYCESHCNEKLKTIGDLGLLVDTLKSEVADGLELPDWAKAIYDTTLLGYLDLLMNDVVKTTEQKRLITGPLLKEIIDNMTKKSKKKLTLDRKMFLYAGHDFSILGLLGSLTNSNQMPQPEFGCSLAFELYKNEDHLYTIKIKYLKSYDDEYAEEIFIPDCGSPCTLIKFQQITQYLIPQDWEAECHLEDIGSIKHSIPKS